VLVDRAVELMGGIDLFLNNAGVLVSGRFEAHSLAQLRALSEVNFVAPIALVNAVLPVMHSQPRGGSILFTASLSSWLYAASISAYAGTKGGVKQFVRSFRRELRITHPHSRIHVGCIYPNVVNTPLVPTSALTGVSASSFQQPEQVADEMLFGVLERRTDIYVTEADWWLATLEMVGGQGGGGRERERGKGGGRERG
jgi:short-subunit dehydrogenase